VAVHARRSDPTRGALHAENDVRSGKDTSVVRATVEHLARAAWGVRRRLDLTISTETVQGGSKAADDSNDVWRHGCPIPSALYDANPYAHCSVISGSLADDLWRFVTSDVFVMAPSSLSFVAAHLREGARGRTVVAVSRKFLTPAAFWMFYHPDDEWQPDNLLFVNATDSHDALGRLAAPNEVARTRDWLLQPLPPP